MKKRISALLLTLTLLLACFPLSALADGDKSDAPSRTFLALGDSISTGYGLADKNDCYANLVGRQVSTLSAWNLAVDGQTSLELRAQLETLVKADALSDKNKEAAAYIATADGICISIGGNDLLGALYAAAGAALGVDMAQPDAQAKLISTIQTGGVANLLKLVPVVTSIKAQAETLSKQFGDNLAAILKSLRTLNPDAKIVVQTIYNPYTGLTDTLGAQMADAVDGIIQNMNQAILALAEKEKTFLVADVYTAFKASKDVLTNASNAATALDPHPNKAGHARIAELVLAQLDFPALPAVTVKWGRCSDWALLWLSKAADLNLIPETLWAADMTKPITRAEFTTVSVLVYEALSGQAAAPASSNPFTDTNDTSVLKAFALGLTTGVTATTFAPERLLNRETAATMLTRTAKRALFEGWTLDKDENFPLSFDMPSAFADNAKISIWAYDSVYFMASSRILDGYTDDSFRPNGTATREQAFKLAVALMESKSAFVLADADDVAA